MVLGHLLVGLLAASVGTALDVLVTGLSWGTIGYYVLSGNLGLLLSAALSYMVDVLGPVDR
ncbi:hypothetical protein FHG66_10975 [Rubellimicrobium rubrum]|uniref:Uncharacterized protein n=1 Tax=Rubellimicrobium rubrum TaxID=2585369 RepID=A0A5C4MX50_9RHOB|nr:hypothetical protein [Rubellimicrobium rubrum]TNC49622.1 hypothetical protein FHG66_10975 [Rubellimicrobium rubrum]